MELAKIFYKKWAYLREGLSALPFILILFWIYITFMQGKEMDLFTINILGLPFRVTHIVIIALSLLSLTSLTFKNIKTNIAFFAFNILGLILLIMAPKTDLRFALSAYGMFFYSMFFYFSYIFIRNILDIRLIIKSIILFNFIGILFFIVKFAYVNKGLPIGIHLSSDVLPIVSAACIFLIWGSELYKSLFYRALILFFLGFIILVKIKGVLFSLLISYFFYKSKKKSIYLNTFSAIVILTVGVKLYFPDLVFTSIFERVKNLEILNESQLFTVGSRLLMWDEATKNIASNFYFGNGLVHFNCNAINLFWANSVGVEFLNINPHSSFLTLTFLGGAISLLLFLKNVYEINFLYSGINKETNALLTIVFFFCISACYTPVFEIFYLGPFFWIFLGILKRQQSNLD